MAIIGKGDIAQQLYGVDKPFITFYASGVSNSRQKDENEFAREIELLLSQPKDQHLVYFSSLCIYYSQSRYAQHKMQVERLIKASFATYTIVRLGNITWGRNPNTILNYFKLQNRSKITPHLEDGHRFIITEQEFSYWMQHLPIGTKNEMNIPGEMVSINEIWERVQNGQY
jgi:hypothetical protein